MSIHVNLNHSRTTATTARSRCRRRSCACGRRRTAARRSTAYSLKIAPGDALHQLAAGSVRQLPGPAGLPGARRASCAIEVDLVAEMAVINPFDFFLEAVRRAVPVPLRRRSWRTELAPYLEISERGPAAGALARRASTARRSATVDFLVDAQPAAAAATSRYVIRMEPGVQTPRGDAGARQRLVPRQRLAAGADPAPPRPRGALRVRLPDPAHPDVKALDGPAGAGGGLHRPARLGRGLPARRRLGRPRPDLAACSPARATSRSPARPSPSQRRADHRLRRRRARSTFELRTMR